MSHATAVSEYAHIGHDAAGVALISGTTMKVIELVMAQLAHGWSPQELHFQFPYLSLGEIHSALAYYWDHREELDQAIEESARIAARLRKEAGPSPIAAKIKAGMV